MATQKNIEDYDPEKYQENNPDFEHPLLSGLMGKNIEISNISFGDASKGMYALVTVKGKIYRTSSEVLVDKLKKMHDNVTSGTVIRVLLDTVKGSDGTYHVFKAPI